MLTLFQKYHRQLNVLLVVLFGLSCGLLAGTLLEASIDPLPVRQENPSRTAAQNPRETTSADLTLILQRNIFDPAGRSNATFNPATASSITAEQRSSAAPQDMVLFGTVVANQDSLALIEIDKQLEIYHLEDSLPGDGRIEEIQRNLVKIRNRDSSLTTLETPESTAAVSTAGKPAIAVRSDETPEIRQVGDNRWLIPTETAEKTRQNLAEELRLAQMQPRIVDGETNGFLIRMIRRTSILNKMGLRRGDVILRVNDMALDSPEKALQIFQQLREARQINVSVERNGKALNFAYELD